jgi:hypothetical protein
MSDPVARSHAVIELSGELGIADAAALGAALSAAMACTPTVTVDLVPRRPWDSPPEPLPFWVMTWVV